MTSSILHRGISVYSVPPELLDSLTVRTIALPQPAEAGPSRQRQAPAPASGGDAANGTLTARGAVSCQTCPGASFASHEEQREHVQGDWHRFNVKAKLNGKVVTAEQWDEMMDGESLVESCSMGLKHARRIIHLRISLVRLRRLRA